MGGFKTFTAVTLPASDVNTYLMQQAIIRCTSTLRPIGPSEGWHIYETDTQRRLVFRNGGWVPYGYPETTYAFKSQTESQTFPTLVTSNLVNDSDLRITLEASSMYWLDAFIMYSSSDYVSPGFGQQLVSFFVPDNCEVLISGFLPAYLDFGAAPPPNVEEMATNVQTWNTTSITGPHNKVPPTTGNFYQPSSSSDAAEWLAMEFFGVVKTVDAGEIQLMWTPFQALEMSLYKDSWMSVRKLLV